MHDDYDENDCSSPPSQSPLPPPTDGVRIKIENVSEAVDIEENAVPLEGDMYSSFVKEEPKSDTEMDQSDMNKAGPMNNYVAPDFLGFSSYGEGVDEEAAEEDGDDTPFDCEETNDDDDDSQRNSEHSWRIEENGSSTPLQFGFNRRNRKIRDPPEQVKIDRRLIRLIEQYPAIWNTCDPDYGNYSTTKKMWRAIASEFPRKINFKLRWKNLRRRFVRLEANIRKGKRIYSFHDKSINFLLNRSLPRNEWVVVDKGENDNQNEDNSDEYAEQELYANENKIEIDKEEKQPTKQPPQDENVKMRHGNEKEKQQRPQDNKIKKDYNKSSNESKDDIKTPIRRNCIEILEVNDTDLKIINFVERNKILWAKAKFDESAEYIEEECNRLWTRLKQMLSDKIDVQSRWIDMYEMYKTFRLTKAESGSVLEKLKLKQSKYLEKLRFLQEIDDETMVREYHINTPTPEIDDQKSENNEDDKPKTKTETETEAVDVVDSEDELGRDDDDDEKPKTETEIEAVDVVDSDVEVGRDDDVDKPKTKTETETEAVDVVDSEDELGRDDDDDDKNKEQLEAELNLKDMKDDLEFVLELVRAVAMYPAIWNSNHSDYDESSSETDRLWEEIADKLKGFGRDTDAIKTRWQLAKYTYTRIRSQHIDSGHEDNDSALPEMERMLFNEMKFLNL